MEIIMPALVSVISSVTVGSIMAFVINRIVKKQESREQERAALLVSMLETTNASLSLGQAMAGEMLENGKCNGKTTAAMEYAQAVKHKQDDQLRHNAAANF